MYSLHKVESGILFIFRLLNHKHKNANEMGEVVTLVDNVKAQVAVSVNFNPDGTIADASGQKQLVDTTSGEEPQNDGSPNDLFVSQAAQDQYATDIATAKANLAKQLIGDNYVNGEFTPQTTTTTTETPAETTETTTVAEDTTTTSTDSTDTTTVETTDTTTEDSGTDTTTTETTDTTTVGS